MAHVLDVLDTPNPNALKFLMDTPLARAEAVFVESPEEAGGHPLAQNLFALPGVASVFLLNNFVTVTRHPNTPWETLRPAVIDILKRSTATLQAPSTMPSEAAQDTLTWNPQLGARTGHSDKRGTHLAATETEETGFFTKQKSESVAGTTGELFCEEKRPGFSVESRDPTGDSRLIARIEQVLDENVRPALAGDGGGVEVAGLKNFVLSVHYQGACGSCPSASSGTLFGIQALLQQKVDPRIQVLPL